MKKQKFTGFTVEDEVLSKEVITISVNEFLTPMLAEQIAQALWNKAEWSSNIVRMVYDGKTQTDCFNIIAKNEYDDVVGRLFCLQNDKNKNLWYYGDLFVVPEYRRRHIGEKMLTLAEETLSNKWCDTLRCYVEHENIISQSLQIKMGYTERPYKSFNNLINDGEIMFEKKLSTYKIDTVSGDDARYVTMIYGKNVKALHSMEILYNEWCSLLSAEDTDERHFLIRKGSVPCGYMKVNGLDSGDIGYISVLAVEPAFQRKGIGAFAVKYAENLMRSIGKNQIGVQTTEDNTSALSLYKKFNFKEVKKIPAIANDNSEIVKVKLIKNL